MNDQELREYYGQYPTPDFPNPAFTCPPNLVDATIAIVTTAGLIMPGEPWDHVHDTFRSFPHEQRGLIVGHPSAGFDRLGAIADLNIIYPVDRLDELVDSGIIKAAAAHHISFMGGVGNLDSVIMDSGPAAAKKLLGEGVDIVFLLPVCPMCPRTANALAHVFESAGLSTIVFASNLGFAERMRPPRALYCDFPIGRPLGVPRDPEFQRAVLRAGLELLDRPTGPVLEIYPIAVGGESEHLVCTIPHAYDPSLPPPVAEVHAIKPAWARTYAENRNVTQVGRLVPPEQIPDAVARFFRVANGDHWQDAGFSSELDISTQAMDIRAFYEEASISLSDHVPAARSGDDWFYGATHSGKLMADVFEQLRVRHPELPAAVFLTLLPMHRPEFAQRFKRDYEDLLSKASKEISLTLKK